MSRIIIKDDLQLLKFSCLDFVFRLSILFPMRRVHQVMFPCPSVAVSFLVDSIAKHNKIYCIGSRNMLDANLQTANPVLLSHVGSVSSFILFFEFKRLVENSILEKEAAQEIE